MDRFLEEPILAETMGGLFGQLVQNFQDNLSDALHHKLLGFPWEEDKPGTHHHFVLNLHGAGILLITRLNGSSYGLAMIHLCLCTGLGSQARSSPKQPSPGRIQRNLGKTVQHSCSLRLLNGCTFVPLCQPDDLVQLPKMLPEPIMHARQQRGRLLAGGLALPSSISFLQVRMTG